MEEDFDFDIDTLRDDFYDFLDCSDGKDLAFTPSPLEDDVTPLTFQEPVQKQFQQKQVNFQPNLFQQQNNQQRNLFSQMPQNFNNNYLLHMQKQSMTQFQNIQQIMNQPKGFVNNFQNNFMKPKYIALIQGFLNPVKERQPGGKDNTKCVLPAQVIEFIFPNTNNNIDPQKLSIQCNLLGFNKKLKQKVRLCTLNTRRFENINSKFLAVFDNLIVKYSSHLHGINGKLYLRFDLLDYNNNVVDNVESQGFLTITKRGLEKKRERLRNRLERQGFKKHVNVCSPPVGLTSGNLLVKIHGEGFLTTPLFNSFVSFGFRKSREIISIKRNLIICETPENKPGVVNVNVSLDGKSFLSSNAKFLYVAPNDVTGVRKIMTNMVNPKNFNFPQQNQNFGGTSSQNTQNTQFNQFEYNNFITGKTYDYRGNNIFHHCACRGYYELLFNLFNNYGNEIDVNKKDNFGRSPLFWSVSSGVFDTSKLLLKNGAKLDLKDDFGDNFIHVASNENECISLKRLLFWILKHDNGDLENTKTLLKLITQKNENGKTPIENSASNDMERLLKSFNVIFLSRINDVIVKSIQIRSGFHNGQSLEKKNILVQFNEKNIVIILNKENKVLIPNGNLAFIILAKNEKRAEITLRKQANIVSSGKDCVEKENAKLMNCLSFFLNLSGKELQKLYNIVKKNKRLYEFKNWSFVYKPSAMTGKSGKMKKSNKKKRKLDLEKPEHILAQKILNFRKNRKSKSKDFLC